MPIGSLRAAVVEFVAELDLHDVALAGEYLGGASALGASIDLEDRVSRRGDDDRARDAPMGGD